MKRFKYNIMILFIIIQSITYSFAQNEVVFFDSTASKPVEEFIYFLEDINNNLTIEEIIRSNDFRKCEKKIPYFGVTSSAIWLKFKVCNKSKNELLLKIGNPLIDQIELYSPMDNGKFKMEKSGELLPYHHRPFDSENFIFNLGTRSETLSYYIKIKGGEPLIIPLSLVNPQVHAKFSEKKNIIVGIYTGIMLAMILYNLFIYISIRDKTYLYYICGVLFVFLVQLEFVGYSYKFLWPSYPVFNSFCPVLFTSFAGFFVFNFARLLLNAKEFAPNFNKVINVGIISYGFAIISKLTGFDQVAFRILDLNAIIFPAYVFVVAIKRSRQNYRPAIFFLLAWSILLVGFSLYAFKDMGILPFNDLTNYTMPAGTAIESILFSFALADRINILKKGNENKQNEIIRHLNESEKNIRAVKESELIVEKLKKETLASQLESLKNQVNPHFLFNSLNVLTELIQQNQHKAVKFVQELSDVYRYVLESRNKSIINLKHEIKFIQAFIYLLRIRFENKISLNISLENGSEEKMIPPLALQLLIENSIKHNVISDESPLQIDVYSEDNYLIVKNFINLKSGILKPSGIGLKNIESRYGFLTDKKVIVLKESEYFIVKIPLLTMFADDQKSSLLNV